ncbi:unnamed protein product [Nyctereutes procyonoides]|uniref:(raccoon dog) hypothetical protein n=1 Tax=Nyctereutes procyonoides TaxID=34880 RepID=A0A811YED3_NYCPR|nr:unnamed protein product [Nyctereutes procyonoides]
MWTNASLMVTNDGATILKHRSDNPAAKVLVDMSRFKNDEFGDCTTSVYCASSRILRNRNFDCKKIHPQTIIACWREATKAADSNFLKINGTLREQHCFLKTSTHHKDHFTQLAVEALERILKHGINCFINRAYNLQLPDHSFSLLQVVEIASTFDHPELVKLGVSSPLIEEVMIGEDKLNPLRICMMHLCVLAQTMLMAHAVTQLAIEHQAKKLLPTIILDNAGYDSADLVAHCELPTVPFRDMRTGYNKSFQVKRQVLLSAAEAAEVNLKRVPDHHPS